MGVPSCETSPLAAIGRARVSKGEGAALHRAVPRVFFRDGHHRVLRGDYRFMNRTSRRTAARKAVLAIVQATFLASTVLAAPMAIPTALAANPSADIDQCGNDPAPSSHTNGCAGVAGEIGWVNGNLGASKSTYTEGDSIPYRLKFDNLSLDSHVVIIEWDTTKAGKHAIDYLTTWNRTVANSDPCLGVSGCSSSTT